MAAVDPVVDTIELEATAVRFEDERLVAVLA